MLARGAGEMVGPIASCFSVAPSQQPNGIAFICNFFTTKPVNLAFTVLFFGHHGRMSVRLYACNWMCKGASGVSRRGESTGWLRTHNLYQKTSTYVGED